MLPLKVNQTGLSEASATIAPESFVLTISKRFALKLHGGVAVEMRVGLLGRTDPETGMMVNLKDLKQWIKPAIATITTVDFGGASSDGYWLERVMQVAGPAIERDLAEYPVTLQWVSLGDYQGSKLKWVPAGASVLDKVRTMYLLTRRYEFSASHRLCNEAFDEARNWEVFYECNNPNGHGHNYELEVMLTGEKDPDTGMLMNLLDLDRIVKEHIIDLVDHKHLNHDVAMLAGKITTAENVVKTFYDRLKEVLPEQGRHLYGLRLHESRNNAAEYYGESPAQG